MLRVSIRNSEDVETNGGPFQDQAAIDEWYDFNKDYFPVPHTVVVTPLADTIVQAQRRQEAKESFDLGYEIRLQIKMINRRKLKAGVWAPEKFNQLLSSTTAAQIERGLGNGSLGTVAYLLTSMSDFYSDLEIGPIVALINAHESKYVNLI